MEKEKWMQILKDKYQKFKEKSITLLVQPLKESFETNITSMQILQELGYNCVYLTFNKPAIDLLNIFSERNIDCQKIHFVDCISKINYAKELKNNASYVFDPCSPQEITSLIHNSIIDFKTKKCVVYIDSISFFFFFNSVAQTINLAQKISKIIEEEKVCGVFCVIEHNSKGNFPLEEINRQFPFFIWFSRYTNDWRWVTR